MENQADFSVLFRGAEATILSNGKQVVKERVEKAYKHPQLDERDRTRRTRSEARILQLARERGVSVPAVLQVDKFRIVMEHVPGKQLTELLRAAQRGEAQLHQDVAANIAEQLSRLHEAGIAHGDLTASNFIISEAADVHIIDFGLAQTGKVREEEKAVDLYVLERSLACMGCEELFSRIRDWYRDAGVLKRLEDVEKRGRKREKEDL